MIPHLGEDPHELLASRESCLGCHRADSLDSPVLFAVHPSSLQEDGWEQHAGYFARELQFHNSVRYILLFLFYR